MAINMEKGSVSIDAQNIMPVIKRWLYSDKDIFLREVVSNGCDAITKFKMLHPGTEEAMSVTVSVDKENKTISISDTGIGMTADEVAGLETQEHNGHQISVDETLLASCSMDITGMVAVFAEAFDYAR